MKRKESNLRVTHKTITKFMQSTALLDITGNHMQ